MVDKGLESEMRKVRKRFVRNRRLKLWGLKG